MSSSEYSGNGREERAPSVYERRVPIKIVCGPAASLREEFGCSWLPVPGRVGWVQEVPAE